MALLFFVCQCFPVVFHFLGLVLPLFSYDLGDVRVGQVWVARDDLCLVMLAIQYESISRSWDLGRRSAETNISCSFITCHTARRIQFESLKSTIASVRSVDGSGTFSTQASSARTRRVWSVWECTKGSGPIVVIRIHGGVGRGHSLGGRNQRDDLCHFCLTLLVLCSALLSSPLVPLTGKRTGSGRPCTLVSVSLRLRPRDELRRRNFLMR